MASSSKRALYSPVDTRHQLQQQQQKSRAHHQTTTDLKYLDDDDEDEEDDEPANQRIQLGLPLEGGSQIGRRSRGGQNEAGSTRRQAANLSHSKRLMESSGGGGGGSEQSASSPEEVYLCTCCGTTKPLDPAMKFVPVFTSLFLLANVLVFLLGLAQVGLGLWFRIDPKVYELHHHIETQNFTIAGWLLLATGASVCLLALCFGCPGSRKQSICLLVFYSVAMTLCTIGAIGALVLLTVYGLGDSLERFLTKEVYEQIRRRTMSGELLDELANFEGATSSSRAAQFIDFVQVKLRCCGALDFRDYQKLGMVIPTTCYTIAANFINAPGCGQALRELLDLRAGLASGLAAASVVVQLLALLLAGLMVCSIYNHRASPRPASVNSLTRPASRSQSHSRSSSGSPDRVPPTHLQRPICAYPPAPPRPISRAPSIRV